MKKIYLIITLLLLTSITYSQKQSQRQSLSQIQVEKPTKNETKSKTKKNKLFYRYDTIVNIIELDYNHWNDCAIPQTLRVGTLYKIRCINLPKNEFLYGFTDYENKNMEDGVFFGTKFIPSNENINTNTKPPLEPNNPIPNIDSGKKEEQKNEETKKAGTDLISQKLYENVEFVDSSDLKELGKKSKSSSTSISKENINSIEKFSYEFIINPQKPYKINNDNLDKTLEIGDAENYLKNEWNKDKENKQLKKALVDIVWQKGVIKYAKENWNKDLYKKDSIFYRFKDSIYNIKNNSTKTQTLIFRVQNYDNTKLSLTTGNNTGITHHTNIDFINYSGIKIDFSTGLVFSKIIDDNYELKRFKGRASDTASTYKDSIRISTSTPPLANVSPCVMAHSFIRNAYSVNVGLTLGLCYNLANKNLNYLLGGSLLFGHEQRCIITFGALLGKVKELNSSFNNNGDNALIYNKGIAADDFTNRYGGNLIYSDRLIIKCALGLTYNLNISNTKSKPISIN